MSHRWMLLLTVLVGLIVADFPRAQGPPPGGRPGGPPQGGPPGGPQGGPAGGGDLELVERLLVSRRDYQRMLEQLRAHYLNIGDVKRARLAEDELRQFHRIPKHPFRLELDVPPPNLHPTSNVPDANRLYTRALEYKNRGYGNDYLDNQRRAEILFQEVLTRYPQSNKISDTAYQLGDVYESKAYKQYDRAAAYFERCFQWNQNTHLDARLRAARLYDRQLQERGRAIEIYREITTHETDAKRIQEATKRLGELSSNPR